MNPSVENELIPGEARQASPSAEELLDLEAPGEGEADTSQALAETLRLARAM